MIAAVLLAAGQSIRMGRSKLELPWKNGQSILSHMVDVFLQAGASPVLVVIGGMSDAIEESLGGKKIEFAHNPDFTTGEMLSSIKVGLRRLEDSAIEAALISPADLPLLRSTTVRRIIQAWGKNTPPILSPSYEERRGHPVLVAKTEWEAILRLADDQTLRDFLRQRAREISYLVVDDPGILYDVDTPEEYRKIMDLEE
jgi:molybdenum cofactor cytidylyltransferase